MKTLLFVLVAFCICGSSALGATMDPTILQAEAARLNPARSEVVSQSSFQGGSGVSLKPGAEEQTDLPGAPPDLTFFIKPAEAGRFVLKTQAAVDAAGQALMAKGKTKHDSLFMKIKVGAAPATRRVVFVPWSAPEQCVQETGIFKLDGAEQEIAVWLPKGVRLDYIKVSPYRPPAVPAAAAEYRPEVTPPAIRPRLWVNAESLPEVRENLDKGENARVWKALQANAAKPFVPEHNSARSTDYDADLEIAAVNKAFVHLMTGDAKRGREAVEMTRAYMDAVEFGNILDVTREIGRAIYAAARVYDWCYDVMSPEERDSIRLNMMRLAEEMEIGWPPFKQGVVNGHGSEAQLLLHLLSMAIAIYDEDPLPYQYCSYRVLEELVPMRAFEYQSPRHNQGIGYGIYRFTFDMNAAWLFYRMTGHKVFNSNIEDVRKYWLYMRLPNELNFADGDGNTDGSRPNLSTLALLISAYAKDPVTKKLFIEQSKRLSEPTLMLLLNDPDLKAAEDLSSLPLTIDFGPVLGGMVARTGWTTGADSKDVVAFMTGGGYHFGNHQHADAGSFQIYYHGMQVVDLGQYVFYGTPYDQNFNKRSIAHSMMLAYDPMEKAVGKLLNDGGQRYGNVSPASREKTINDPRLNNGTILSSSFGPSKDKPAFSYLSMNLAAPYGKKLKNYVRTFCFLNLENEKTPAALLVLDHMEISGPEIIKSWQVNTLNRPEITTGGLILSSSEGDTTGRVVLQMLLPKPENRDLNIVSGKDASTVSGKYLVPPRETFPQAKGYRAVFSPAKQAQADTFLTVMTMTESADTTMAVDLEETTEGFVVSLADRVVVLSKSGERMKEAFQVDIKGNGNHQLLLTGLAPGTWIVRDGSDQIRHKAEVMVSDDTTFVVVPAGQYRVERDQ